MNNVIKNFIKRNQNYSHLENYKDFTIECFHTYLFQGLPTFIIDSIQIQQNPENEGKIVKKTH